MQSIVSRCTSHLTYRRSVTAALIVASVSSALAFTAAPKAAHAQLTFFTSRTTFTTTNPGLTAEGFETSPSTNRTITGPIDSTTTATTLITVVPGFRVQAVGTTGVPGSGSNQFFYNASSSFNTGNGTRVLTTNFTADSQDITFSGLVSAFGLDLGASDTSYTIRVFNTSGTELGNTTVTPANGTFSFFGVTSTQNIGRVNVASPNFENTDNFLFGVASGSAAPEPGSIVLALVGSGPLLLGLARRRRSKASKKAAQAQ